MKAYTEDDRTRVALWRFDLISPLVTRALPHGARAILLRELVKKTHVGTDGELIKVGVRTLERYLADYRQDGLEGLKPKIRTEKDSLKAFGEEALEAAIQLRKAKPELSADSIIDVLLANKVKDAEKISVSTLNRHFQRLCQDRPSLKRQTKKRYNLLSVERVHQLWVCDVWDGPKLFDPVQNQKRQLRLVAIIEAYARFIVQAEFYFNENRPCLEDTLMKAILKHGVCECYYVDNAKIFHSQHLKRIAAELGFRIHHTQPYTPQGRGRIERWFRTVAEKFEPLLKDQIESGRIKNLADVNQFLVAWIEQRYHQKRHSTLKMSPNQAIQEAALKGLVLSRFVDPQTVRETFLWREKRRVSSLAAIKILGNMYEVDESLMGKEVDVRYNPYDLSYMLVYFKGEFRGKAIPYRLKNFTEKRVADRAETQSSAMNRVMEQIVAEHTEHTRRNTGISYARAMKETVDE